MKSPFLPRIALGASLLAGCASQPGISLPGDIDDAPADTGKGDEWDYSNDPARLANRLNYRLAELPREGKLDKPVWAARYRVRADDVAAWADTYWPTARGSTNARWLGATVPSPLEKYDAVFNGNAGCETQPAEHCGDGARAAWDEYLGCAGPAAKWHAESFQGMKKMYDGRDSDGDGEVDECGDNDGIAGWWGLCHAWSPAALLEPEPKHAVTYQGVTFEVADIKALLITLYDRNDALMLGGRCNAETIEHDENGAVAETDCKDVNAGALHVVLANFLGIADQALVEDRTASSEVWNQPLLGYTVNRQDKVDVARANACIGRQGEAYAPNPEAKELYEVQLTTDYLYEGQASSEPLGMANYTGHDTYHYILEVDGRGKIIGGEYCNESKDSHPDFLWAPTGMSRSSWGRNPNVDPDKVKILLNLSREDGPPGGGGDDLTVENNTATAIPDADTNGVKLDIAVTDDIRLGGLSVTVDIEHSWRGDLHVELHKDGRNVKTLHDQAGGSADDLRETYTVSAAELGSATSKGTWSLVVADMAKDDTGTVKSWKLTFHAAQ